MRNGCLCRRSAAFTAARRLVVLADDLLRSRPNLPALFMAFDAAGERILGAAMAVADETLEVFDYTRPFPDRATCVLVGGFIAARPASPALLPPPQAPALSGSKPSSSAVRQHGLLE